jgi:predicted ABC-type ATPase
VSGQQKQLWVIAGPNGAGKTTLVSRRVAARIPVVNPDDIAAGLPRIHGRLDERQAGLIALKRRAAFLDASDSFAIETTLTGHSALRLIDQAKTAGYKITLVFVGLSSVDLSILRVTDRVDSGGHAVPISALDRRYPEALAHLSIAAKFADRIFVLDNSGRRRRLLLSVEYGRTRFATRDLPAWFLSAYPGFGDRGAHDQ